MSLDVLAELERAGAVLLNRHFVYKSGKHGGGYVNMDPLFTDPQLVNALGEMLIRPFAGSGIDTVAAPATGAITLAFAAASAYGRRVPRQDPAVRCVWADKHGSDFVFERAGFVEQLRGKRVLVVEDLLTTGGSVHKVCRAAEEHGAEVVGVSAVCNRGDVTATSLGVSRLESLTEVRLDAVEPHRCPLCDRGEPIVEDIGHGAAYKADHPDYAGGFVRLLRG